MVTKQQVLEMQEVYSVRAQFASNVYLTPMQYDKSVLVRMTFTEWNDAAQEQKAVCAVVMVWEDVTKVIGAFQQLLEHMTPKPPVVTEPIPVIQPPPPETIQ